MTPETNPYRTPGTGESVEASAPEPISPTRCALNIGCGLLLVFSWIPLLWATGLALLEKASGASVGSFLVNFLFMLGGVHSIVWAFRRRRRKEARSRTPAEEEARNRQRELRRTHGY